MPLSHDLQLIKKTEINRDPLRNLFKTNKSIPPINKKELRVSKPKLQKQKHSNFPLNHLSINFQEDYVCLLNMIKKM